MDNNQITLLKDFIILCQKNSDIIHIPEIKFFKDYLESLGAKIPPKSQKPSAEGSSDAPDEAINLEDSEESDLDIDNSGVIEPDSDEPQEMGDDSKEISEEDLEKSSEKRTSALAAFEQADYTVAIKLFSEAIVLNPASALLHAKRANCYLKLQKPNAAIKDCNKAVLLNPDNATAYKFRGFANRLLGNWEEAARDLRMACKLDYDDQANEWLKEVTPNAHKIEEHRRKYARKREEKDLAAKKEKFMKMKEEREKAAKANEEAKKEFGAGAGGMPDMSSFLNDPDIAECFKDPEVSAAVADLVSNPSNFAKYLGNPKVMRVFNKFASKMGGMPGGMGGMPGMFNFPPGGSSKPPSSSGPSDIDLD